MVAADVSDFLAAVRKSGQPLEVLTVFMAIGRYVETNTGRLTCSQRQLAKAVGMDVRHVHRAIDKLVGIGVLIREARGQYRCHPGIIWRGGLAERAETLRVIEGGRARKRA